MNNLELNRMFKKLIIIGVIFLLSIFYWGKILAPFLLAFLTAYLIEPIILNINKKFKLSRKLISLVSSFLILSGILGFLLFIVPGIIFEINIVINKIPSIINYVNNDLVSYLNSNFHTKLANDLIFIDPDNISAKSLLKNHPSLVQSVTLNGFHLFQRIVFLFLYPIILFFCIKNYEHLIVLCKKIFSSKEQFFLSPIIKEISVSLSKYFRGQLIVSLIMTIYYSLITIIFHGSFFIAVITGLLLFIPWVGFITGIFLSVIYSLTTNSEFCLFYIFIIYGLGYLIEHWLVMPYFIGNSLGIHPIMIILSILVLGSTFGIVGIILALPLTAVLNVVLRNIFNIHIRSLN